MNSSMKTKLHFLTIAAGASTAAFVGLLMIGLVSLTVFLTSAMIWLLLVAISAYAPRERAPWLPRLAATRVNNLPKIARRASFPYAA